MIFRRVNIRFGVVICVIVKVSGRRKSCLFGFCFLRSKVIFEGSVDLFKVVVSRV